ncbi:hypothetical protein GOP47_0023385 [Adiantum capillus-veneris]|uniref:Uncharacterized protein n=1 Tax=Adiantum capillus-veneris TaxID=13818 RepID=A0A9D4Z4G8_ADICA|nr:hypothetical protein GOP47_0023385 [Adiantum capillus-veneris]
MQKFLADDFVKGTKILNKFMSNAANGTWMYVNEMGVEYVHTMVYERIPGKDKEGNYIDPEGGDVDTCKQLARNFFHKVIDCVNDRFTDVFFLIAMKMFSPQFYPKDAKCSKSSMDREKKENEWLSRLLEKLGGSLVDAQGCRDEVLSFTDTLYYACEMMSMKDAWQLFASNAHWQRTYPNLLKLW